jgi:hypothetical protein
VIDVSAARLAGAVAPLGVNVPGFPAVAPLATVSSTQPMADVLVCVHAPVHAGDGLAAERT